ncbi:MAG: TatD family hydrolase [Candidatus Caldatribacteriota bacterium]|nr:TatD family hydrolase [Atribacterota bacterium]
MRKINIQFIETHAHLDIIKKKTDVVISDALKSGVKDIITIGVDLESSKKNINYAKQYKDVFTAIGFHPHESKKMREEELYELETMISNPKNVALGEIGLDYYYMHSKKEDQKSIFREQIDLAKKYNLPVIIHDRDAHYDTIKILKEKAKNMKVVLHCFSGDMDMAQWCIERGYFFGIGGVVTFKNAKELVKIVKEIPIDNILLETDSPFLTPVPFRGKPNEPKYIPIIAEKIAEIKEKDIDEIAKITSKNARDFFSLKKL